MTIFLEKRKLCLKKLGPDTGAGYKIFKNILSLHRVRNAREPPRFLQQEFWMLLSSWIKRAKREAYYSHPSSAKG